MSFNPPQLLEISSIHLRDCPIWRRLRKKKPDRVSTGCSRTSELNTVTTDDTPWCFPICVLRAGSERGKALKSAPTKEKLSENSVGRVTVESDLARRQSQCDSVRNRTEILTQTGVISLTLSQSLPLSHSSILFFPHSNKSSILALSPSPSSLSLSPIFPRCRPYIQVVCFDRLWLFNSFFRLSVCFCVLF